MDTWRKSIRLAEPGLRAAQRASRSGKRKQAAVSRASSRRLRTISKRDGIIRVAEVGVRSPTAAKPLPSSSGPGYRPLTA